VKRYYKADAPLYRHGTAGTIHLGNNVAETAILAQPVNGKTVAFGKLEKNYQNGKSCRFAPAPWAPNLSVITYLFKRLYDLKIFFLRLAQALYMYQSWV
jgi:hypothetical protein